MGGILGRLALGIIEIRRDGNDGTVELIVKAVFGTITQRSQDLGADLDRRLVTGTRADAHHALVGIVGLQRVMERIAIAGTDIVEAAAHEALDRHQGVVRVIRQVLQRLVADLATTILQVAHGRRQQQLAIGIRQALGVAMAQRGHQRMRGAQVNAHRDAALVRIRRLAGFGNL